MKKMIWLFLISGLLYACNNEEDILNIEDRESTVAGRTIFILLSGNNQIGLAGEPLETDIALRATTFSGRVVNRRLEFELSDTTGSASLTANSHSSDSMKIQWTLGYQNRTQALSIIYPDVCELSLNGCVSKKIFEIKATAQ